MGKPTSQKEKKIEKTLIVHYNSRYKPWIRWFMSTLSTCPCHSYSFGCFSFYCLPLHCDSFKYNQYNVISVDCRRRNIHERWLKWIGWIPIFQYFQVMTMILMIQRCSDGISQEQHSHSISHWSLIKKVLYCSLVENGSETPDTMALSDVLHA